MSPHAQVRLAAAGAAWLALAVGGAAAPALWWVVLFVMCCLGALWASRRALQQSVPFVVAVTCVLLVLEGRSIPSAAGVGILLLVHVLLADLLRHTAGAGRADTRAAIREVLPALSLGAGAALTVAVAVAPAAAAIGEPWATVLRLGAPFVLLVVVLLALGLATRRPGWAMGDERGVSALTRRYLDRVAQRH